MQVNHWKRERGSVPAASYPKLREGLPWVLPDQLTGHKAAVEFVRAEKREVRENINLDALISFYQFSTAGCPRFQMSVWVHIVAYSHAMVVMSYASQEGTHELQTGTADPQERLQLFLTVCEWAAVTPTSSATYLV